jgi:hypothetical protein
VPIRPVVHYMMGGISTNTAAATPLPGLFAAGECACVSLNGANRLGSNSLVELLVFGRRAALSPVLASGGASFVDVSAIPISAVERVEVLSDGASATYGSDAVSGVVNIILKTNYVGSEVGGSYGFSTNKGNWANRSYYGIAGATPLHDRGLGEGGKKLRRRGGETELPLLHEHEHRRTLTTWRRCAGN